MNALRPYQEQAVAAIEAGWRTSRRQLLSIPTGGGKTAVIARVIAAERGRALVLAHRDELITQACSQIIEWAGGQPTVEKAESRASLRSRVVVASVQSMSRRLSEWPADHFSIVVVDEAHRTPAASYMKILDHFAGARVLGCTATPYRRDGKSLGKCFDQIAYEISMLQLIQEGYLVNIYVDTLPVEVDLSDVRRRAGDFADEDLAGAIHPHLLEIANAVAREYRARRILAFTPLRSISEDFAEACRACGLRAAHIDGESSDRRSILRRFEAGEISLLSNAALLSEGYDHPRIDTVLILRPTLSRGLYAQMIGRGTRPAPQKDRLIVLDPTFRHDHVKLFTPASLVAKTQEEEELFERFLRDGGDTGLLSAASKVEGERQRQLARAIAARVERVQGELAVIEGALRVPEGEIEPYNPEEESQFAPATERQQLYLKGLGIKKVKTFGVAQHLIEWVHDRYARGLCSVKQAKFIAARHLASEPYELSKDEASALIERFLESVGAR